MMRSHSRTFRLLALALVAAFVFTLHVGQGLALAAGTSPGTVISNTATATYSDGNGTSYTTNSNTVTTTVQNAPSLTVAPPTAQSVAPGQVVIDTYTLTNTGNAAGNFSLPSAGTVGSNGTLNGYVISGTTCTNIAPCTLTQANTALAALTATAVGGTITIGIEYTVSPTATTASTIPTTLTANITEPAVGTVPAATSANATGTVTDTVLAQARLDLQKSTVAPTAPTGPSPGALNQDIQFTITGNNGGGFAATDLQSVQALLGTTKPGILVTDLIPQFGGKPLNLDTTNAAPTVTLANAVSGATATLYYSTSATGAASSWSTTYVPGDYFVAAFISGGAGGAELPSAPSGSAGAGAVTTPQVTLKFATVQPSGTGAANAGSITNIANSVIGGNPGATGITPIIGPFAGTGEADSANPTTPITGAIDNTTSSTSTGAPGGSSNTVTSQAYATNQVLVGPLNFAGATGSYPAATNNGTGAASNLLDYTAVGFDCANGAAINNGTFQCVIPTGGIVVPGTYFNSGNGSDTLTISVTAPAGFVATIYPATGCASSITSLNNTSCTFTSPYASGSGNLGSVPSQTGGNYVVVYTPVTAGTSSVAPFVALDSVVTVSGTQGGTVASDTNTTHIDLYPGGPIQLTKAQAIVTGCPTGSTGQTAGAVCPGGTITYTINYANLAPAASSVGGTNIGTEPAFAYNAINTAASGTGLFLLTEDGLTAPNNWGTYTNGLTAAPSTTGTTTFTFSYMPTTGTAAGSTKFTAQAGGTIAAGATGSITFSAIVK